MYFRSAPMNRESEAPRPIPLDDAHHTVVIPLVDETIAGWKIGLSWLEHPDLPRLGFNRVHGEDFAAELAHYLLEAGAALAHGGRLQSDSLTTLLRDLVWTYDASQDETPKLFGYLAWPEHRGTLQREPRYKNWLDPKNQNRSEFKFLPLPDGVSEGIVGSPNDRSPANLLVYARCMTAMWQRMDEEIEARVLLGGSVRHYHGRYPSFVEKALLARRSGKPVFLIGCFGGAVGAIIEALCGRKADALTEAFQFEDVAYKEMVALHNALPGVEPVDYAALTAEFKKWGLSGLCKSNGLRRTRTYDFSRRHTQSKSSASSSRGCAESSLLNPSRVCDARHGFQNGAMLSSVSPPSTSYLPSAVTRQG